MLADTTIEAVHDEDHLALAAACEPGVGLCTIVGIEGSFSRRLGAQLAVLPDGSTVGDLADSCLESQLASDIAQCRERRVVRYGRGSSRIDFRLPCGGGLDILLDPAPDRGACRAALGALKARRTARLALGGESPLLHRTYLPTLKLVVLGEGPELETVASLSSAMKIEAEVYSKDDLALGQTAPNVHYDPWTACLLLFHDHEWELALLEQALASEAFYIGAQGGERARRARTLALAARGIPEEIIARLTSPVGLMSACKSPRSLALSALSEILGHYEQMRAAA
ncbi:XdhC family protein [Alteriqipengyuania flavescens]|uniref:XdhC family protein n=1 Tax=Alteriqipengyuania flavescens TaxID=3053610 RepID=UPI0025B55378|nr:XdhC family protein [Alteriqipengyuania flavescens]WJY17537.1 XdhC family protein [Alteriqipengyuania flavescens]WJY23480.1 XdhC family protein [Alteriqipengyuania flavescens]